MAEPEDVFVSYSRQDNDKVQALTSKLRSAGVRLWMDVRNIDGAAMWGEEIVNAVAKSKVLLLLVSKTSVTSRTSSRRSCWLASTRATFCPWTSSPPRFRGASGTRSLESSTSSISVATLMKR